MPRPSQKTKGAPWVYAYPSRLTDDQKKDLIDGVLGIDMDSRQGRRQAKQIAINIEHYLGAYLEFVKNKPPSPESLRNELAAMREEADNLYEKFCKKSYHLRALLEAQSYDIGNLTMLLVDFVDVSGKALRSLETGQSGRPKDRALKTLVNTLHQQFEKSYSVELNNAEDDPKGTRKIAAKKEALIGFLKGCLDAANIKYPQDIVSLIYNEKTPQSERYYIRQFG